MTSRCLEFIVIILSLVKVLTAEDNERIPFKPPCSVRRMEMTFPHVVDVRLRHVTSGLPGDTTSKQYEPTRDWFSLGLTWRRRKLKIVLYRTDLVPPRSFSEWNEGNETVSERLDARCFYHGYVRGQVASYVAVSTCLGVAGYIQTDEELLFVEPTATHNGLGMALKAHLIYTCEGREPASTQDDWAPSGSDDHTMDKHWREKRSTKRKTKHLEVFMAVDDSVTRVVGKRNINIYLLTLMNIVNSVYQHSSLGVDIKVSLVRIMELDSDDQKRIIAKQDAYRTVRNFCQWALHLYRPGDPRTHDIAVLLTREQLGPAGYAPITGLCNPMRSCAAIKDEGFTSAFIIAHEMAHVFGLMHDGHGNRCHGPRYRSSIMAGLVEAKMNHFWWSRCSSERMKQVIDYLYCLDDEPYTLKDMPELPAILGSPWTLEQQCRLEFGEQFSLCKTFYSNPCSMLWCSTRDQPLLCRTKRGPPLPGSPCGRDRRCRNGQCSYVGHEQPVNGRWGAWSPWSSCSTDCGVGLRYRARKCDNPSPDFGGKSCDGEKDATGTCVTTKCKQWVDLRAGQCSVWDEMNIRPGSHKWLPYQAKRAEDYCKQTCISSSTQEVVSIDVLVEDGTPCTYNDHYTICIDGKCQKVGCDGVTNSSKSVDACGVCDGDGSDCKTVEGDFTKVPLKADEYEQIVFLPSGARNVEITKSQESPHFLAVKDPEQGVYILNGDKRKQSTQNFIAHGAAFIYTTGRTFESLVSRGPLMKNLEIMFYPNSYRKKASVTYSYTVNKDDHTLEKYKYRWKFEKWSGCSVTCGTGVQSIIHGCFDKGSGARLNNEMCSYLDTPRKDQATCHREPCEQYKYNWVMSNKFTECSISCGEGGMKKRLFSCEIAYHNGTFIPTSMDKCSHLDEPIEEEPCNDFPCLQKWTVGEWGKCSKTCGMGVMKRTVYCVEKGSPNVKLCFPEKHPSEKICSGPSCRASQRDMACKDKYPFCRMASSKKCRLAGFRKMCCAACQKGRRRSPAYRRWYAMIKKRRARMRSLRLRKFRRFKKS
ncbi:A disintegrin and metalloproteinase with thrombospondin motifs 3-like [Gigantopelta aegis]|uniref:A disintegrin and metalloproteinase with thrombospondin motifs 3-like n=1 Tax=Gigantopelta aegis TaxID=1735272 RepID=UPI001B88D043|nr:A disintegrin and metalloproteinase with thrombospondin motifs 3-like [Gigantopelta aegis]